MCVETNKCNALCVETNRCNAMCAGTLGTMGFAGEQESRRFKGANNDARRMARQEWCKP
jgi:hypothetical protein